MSVTASPASARALARRVDTLPWDDLRAQLETRGFAVTAPLLGAPECEDLAGLR